MTPNDFGVEIKEFTSAHEETGSLKRETEEDKLMKSVLQNEKKTINQGQIISSAMNMGISNFNPDMMFQNITKNYSIAEQIYGESLIRLLTGYNSSYINKNISIPEFQRELREKIKDRIDEMKMGGFIDKEGSIEEKGLSLSALLMFVEELDHLTPQGYLGKHFHKKTSFEGDPIDIRPHKKGDKYKNVAIKKSIKMSLKRGRNLIEPEDLRVMDRQRKGQVQIVYGLDASGSMKGEKIEKAKKAGIALAYRAIQNRDKVGLIVFGSDVRKSIMPTHDFDYLLRSIAEIKATKETSFVGLIQKAVELFPETAATKHLIILSDALPTAGSKPEQETLDAITMAKNANITVSLVGIDLSNKGAILGQRIVEIGDGRLYQVKNIEELDALLIEEYYAVA